MNGSALQSTISTSASDESVMPARFTVPVASRNTPQTKGNLQSAQTKCDFERERLDNGPSANKLTGGVGSRSLTYVALPCTHAGTIVIQRSKSLKLSSVLTRYSCCMEMTTVSTATRV